MSYDISEDLECRMEMGKLQNAGGRAVRVTHLSQNKISPAHRDGVSLDSSRTCDAWRYKFHEEKFPILLRSFQIPNAESLRLIYGRSNYEVRED